MLMWPFLLLSLPYSHFLCCGRFHADIFERDGVAGDKLVIVPESVDVEFFDPAVVDEATPLTALFKYGIGECASPLPLGQKPEWFSSGRALCGCMHSFMTERMC